MYIFKNCISKSTCSFRRTAVQIKKLAQCTYVLTMHVNKYVCNFVQKKKKNRRFVPD